MKFSIWLKVIGICFLTACGGDGTDTNKNKNTIPPDKEDPDKDTHPVIKKPWYSFIPPSSGQGGREVFFDNTTLNLKSEPELKEVFKEMDLEGEDHGEGFFQYLRHMRTSYSVPDIEVAKLCRYVFANVITDAAKQKALLLKKDTCNKKTPLENITLDSGGYELPEYGKALKEIQDRLGIS